MPRYKQGFEQVSIYLSVAEHQRLEAYWLRRADKNLSACCTRLLLERLSQVDPPAAVENK